MRIEMEARGGCCILRLKGRFVTGSNLDYERTRDELQRCSLRKVVADLGEVPYIDSTGLSFLVGLYTTQKNAGGHFVLANLSPRVRSVLALTKLDGVIPCFADEASALAAMGEAKKVSAA